jgi:O-antigen ligase
MKNVTKLLQWWEIIREQFSPLLIFLILALLAALFLGVIIGAFNLVYGLAVVGALILVIIVQLRWDELTVMLIIAVHVLIDWYLALRLVSLLMALVLLFVCYFGRSANHPWFKPRLIWLWVLFLTLTIYPAIHGALDLYDADTYYPSLVLSAFIMFWLGNIIAKDISSVRRVFQLLSIFATLIAVHTIIEATTGKFLFESARGEAALAQSSNYQLVQNTLQTVGAGFSRAGSFYGHPNGNGTFLAFNFFLPLGLFIVSKQLWAKMIYLLEMLLIVMALMFTYSTGAWIALLTGMLAFVVFVGRLRYSVLMLILIAILTVIVFTVFPSQLALQLSHASANNESSLHVGGWQTALRVTEAFPLFGVGMGDLAYLIRAEPFRVPAQITPLFEPDNSYLQWGAIAGIPVMLVFLLLLGYVFWLSWRNWWALDTHYRPLLGGGIVALIALSINSFSINGWTNPGGLASLGWLVAGLVASPLIGRTLHQRQQPAPSEEGRGSTSEKVRMLL